MHRSCTLGGVVHHLVKPKWQPGAMWHWWAKGTGETLCGRPLRLDHCDDPAPGQHVYSTAICGPCWQAAMHQSAITAGTAMRRIWGKRARLVRASGKVWRAGA